MKKYRNFIPSTKNEEKLLNENKNIKNLINIFITINLILFSFIIINYNSNDEVEKINSENIGKSSSYDEVLNYINVSNGVCKSMLIENGVGNMIIYDLDCLDKISKLGQYIIRSNEDNVYEVKFE